MWCSPIDEETFLMLLHYVDGEKGKALKWASKLCKWKRINSPSATHTKGSSGDLQSSKNEDAFVVIIRRFCLRNVKDAEIISRIICAVATRQNCEVI